MRRTRYRNREAPGGSRPEHIRRFAVVEGGSALSHPRRVFATNLRPGRRSRNDRTRRAAFEQGIRGTVPHSVRTMKPRRYLMCRPTHFAVTYRINPWMDPTAPYDNALAVRQWETLRQTYLDLGHTVELIEPL